MANELLQAKKNQHEKSNNIEETTRRINSIIDDWPVWKKEAYNENFAVSKYSSKLVIRNY
ncbi:MAG: hypothetical protein QM315_07675 [Bacillota bacterium]|jgi:hypothetical protein|nr:hypothetical protein [Bacillota bacterium]